MSISQLNPNTPGHKGLTSNPWAVPYQGYLHTVTASHNGETNVLYVHIGCPVLLEDTVREGENVWDAIRRVVYAWQAEILERDHVEALETHAKVDPLAMEFGDSAEIKGHGWIRGHDGTWLTDLDGVGIRITYTSVSDWSIRFEDGGYRMGETNSREQGEGRELCLPLVSVMACALEMSADYVDDLDAWDDYEDAYPYEDEYPYSEPYDSDLYGEY